MNSGVGFYGKLPGAGDFVRRRLPSTFIDGWDRHFQRAIETGRRELGAQWTDAWRQGAAWRFMLPSQVCGNDAWTGLIGPATDRLGRAFPMVLAARCPGSDAAGVLGNSAWFDALERVHTSAQREAISVETFDARVAALPDPQRGAGGCAALWRGLPWDSGEWQVRLPAGAASGPLLAQAWTQLGLRPGAWCLWWREAGATLLATRGLPRSYAVLLDPRADEAGRIDVPVFAGTDLIGDPVDVMTEPTSGSRDDTQRSPLMLGQVVVQDGFEPVPGVTSSDAHDDRTTASLAGAATEPDRIDPPPLLALTQANEDESATLVLDAGRLLVLSADDGPWHPQRRAARSIRETARTCVPDLASLRAALMAVHARLRAADAATAADLATDLAPADSSDAGENGAALLACFDGDVAHLLRMGAAAAWHWRRGQLQPLFVERPAGAGGEFDDLLFGQAWLDMPGIGAAGEPDCDETAVHLEAGDRLLLLVTREVAQLSPDCFGQALAMPTEEEARHYLARCARLDTPPAGWPFAVVSLS